MKVWLIKSIIRWLWARHKYLMMDQVIPPTSHIHLNPHRKPKIQEEQNAA